MHNVVSMLRLKYFARGKVGRSYLASSHHKNTGEFYSRRSRKFHYSRLLHVNNPFGFGWGKPTHTLVPWRQGFRHLIRNECMGWFAQIFGSPGKIVITPMEIYK